MKLISADTSSPAYAHQGYVPHANEQLPPLAWFRLFKVIFNSLSNLNNRIGSILAGTLSAPMLAQSLPENPTTGAHFSKSCKFIDSIAVVETVYCSQYAYASLSSSSVLDIRFGGSYVGDTVDIDVANGASAVLEVKVNNSTQGRLGAGYNKSGKLKWSGGSWVWFGT
jgi:hypothetical protein